VAAQHSLGGDNTDESTTTTRWAEGGLTTPDPQAAARWCRRRSFTRPPAQIAEVRLMGHLPPIFPNSLSQCMMIP